MFCLGASANAAGQVSKFQQFKNTKPNPAQTHCNLRKLSLHNDQPPLIRISTTLVFAFSVVLCNIFLTEALYAVSHLPSHMNDTIFCFVQIQMCRFWSAMHNCSVEIGLEDIIFQNNMQEKLLHSNALQTFEMGPKGALLLLIKVSL